MSSTLSSKVSSMLDRVQGSEIFEFCWKTLPASKSAAPLSLPDPSPTTNRFMGKGSGRRRAEWRQNSRIENEGVENQMLTENRRLMVIAGEITHGTRTWAARGDFI